MYQDYESESESDYNFDESDFGMSDMYSEESAGEEPMHGSGSRFPKGIYHPKKPYDARLDERMGELHGKSKQREKARRDESKAMAKHYGKRDFEYEDLPKGRGRWGERGVADPRRTVKTAEEAKKYQPKQKNYLWDDPRYGKGKTSGGRKQTAKDRLHEAEPGRYAIDELAAIPKGKKYHQSVVDRLHESEKQVGRGVISGGQWQALIPILAPMLAPIAGDIIKRLIHKIPGLKKGKGMPMSRSQYDQGDFIDPQKKKTNNKGRGKQGGGLIQQYDSI